MTKLEQALELSRQNLAIFDAFTKADTILNKSGYKNICCSISGGGR